MASGDMKIQAGQYWIDEQTWFDIRFTDAGWVISLCDIDMNVRYTAMVDNGKVILAEVDKLIREEPPVEPSMEPTPPEEPKPD